jgi:hypothetical protein
MKEKIANILINEYGYSDHAAEVTAADLLNLQPLLQPVLQAWLDTRAITEVEVQGFSINQLMAREYTFPSALISLDWLLTEPDVAKAELTDEIRR